MNTLDSGPRLARGATTVQAGRFPRLLPERFGGEPASLEEHVARYGQLPRGWDGRWREQLIAEVGRAGLTGRGGAGFPTARKLAAVAAGRDAPVVVANGTEGEPASAKDKVLLACAPHLVLDGAVLAAHMLGPGRRSWWCTMPCVRWSTARPPSAGGPGSTGSRSRS